MQQRCVNSVLECFIEKLMTMSVCWGCGMLLLLLFASSQTLQEAMAGCLLLCGKVKQLLAHLYSVKLQTRSDCYTEGCPKLPLVLHVTAWWGRGTQSRLDYRGTLQDSIATLLLLGGIQNVRKGYSQVKYRNLCEARIYTGFLIFNALIQILITFITGAFFLYLTLIDTLYLAS